MFNQSSVQHFTQGTIFSCAVAENYPTTEVYGLVITARCDAAQDKAPIYNYIPVIPLIDWMLIDGGDIVFQRALSHYNTTLRQPLQELGLSESLLRTKSYEEIITAHLEPKANSDRKWKSKVEKFITHAERIKSINLASKDYDRGKRIPLLKIEDKIIDGLIKELAENRLTGHYLLRDMPTLSEHKVDHVALLREIHHIPSMIAKQIKEGVDKESLTRTDGYALRCPRFQKEDDFSMPLARLKSPWMEHLMQTLTLLFARIGVEDIDHRAVKHSLLDLRLES
jgi:hypothetical protein